MRPTRIATLVLCLIACGQVSRPLFAGDTRRAPRAPANPPPAKPHVSWTVESTFPDRDGAIDFAYQQSEERVRAYLASHHPPMRWPGSDDYVREHVKRWAKDSGNVDEKAGQFVATVPFEMSEADYQEMVKLDRHHRAQERQLPLAKGLAGLLAMLAALAGFFRLKESKRCKSSRVAGAAAVALVGIVSAGCLFMV